MTYAGIAIICKPSQTFKSRKMSPIPPPNKRWTSEVVAILNAKNEAGITHAQLAKEYDVSASAIQAAIAKEKKRIAKDKALRQARDHAIAIAQAKAGSVSPMLPKPQETQRVAPAPPKSRTPTGKPSPSEIKPKSAEYEHFLRAVRQELELKAQIRLQRERKIRIVKAD
jgi:hypothetical protein